MRTMAIWRVPLWNECKFVRQIDLIKVHPLNRYHNGTLEKDFRCLVTRCMPIYADAAAACSLYAADIWYGRAESNQSNHRSTNTNTNTNNIQ